MTETTTIDIHNEEFIASLEVELKDIVMTDDIPGAANFYHNLESLLATKSDQLADDKVRRRYHAIISLAKWVALTSVESYKDVAGIITENILFLLRNEDADLWDKMEQKLRSIVLLEDRDELRDVVKAELLKSEAQISQGEFQLGVKRVRGTVANWLQYYNSVFTADQVSSLKLREFLNSDENIKNLDNRERELLARLYYFYEKLKQSSFSFEGIEDYIFVDDGKNIGWIHSGSFIPLKSIDQQRMAINYGHEILKKALGDEYRNFFRRTEEQGTSSAGTPMARDSASAEFSGNADKLLAQYKLKSVDWQQVISISQDLKAAGSQVDYTAFHLAINQRHKERIIASLLRLANLGYLDEIFERDEKIREIFKQHLQKKFGEKLVGHFEKNLREPVYLSYFLQHLLKDILKLDDNESAVLAIKLVNELKRAGDKQYIAIAYGDLQSGNFKWKTIIEKDDKLSLQN